MTDSPRFIHLRLHTEYSLLEGAVRLKTLPRLAASAGMPAVAVTDTNNLFSALEFAVGASDAGVQPIIGCELDLAYDAAAPGEPEVPPAHVVLLAQNEAGYNNLMKLNTDLYLGRDRAVELVTLDELARHSGGLICLTGGPDGPAGRLLRRGQRAKAEALMTRLAAAFPRPPLRGVAAPSGRGRRAGSGAADRAGLRRDGLRDGSAAGCHERCLFSRPGHVRGP